MAEAQELQGEQKQQQEEWPYQLPESQRQEHDGRKDEEESMGE